MNIKDAYYYAFYKIYKLLEQFARPNWLIKSKAKGLFSVLPVSIIWSLYFYYKILTNKSGNDGSILCLILSIVTIVINLFLLYSDDRIKVHINKFESWPKEKNERLSSIAAIIVIVIAFSFISSVILYNQKFYPHR